MLLKEVTSIKFLVIVNPHSGKKESRKVLDVVVPIFKSNNIELSITRTEFPGHAKELTAALDLDIYHALLVVGGDGTFHEVVNGLLNRTDGRILPIGLIPAGSGNSVMHDLDLINPAKAAEAIVAGNTRFIDVAQVQMNHLLTYSINLIGWGLVTDVGKRSETFRWLGPSRYTVSSIIEILLRKTRKARLVIDQETIVGQFSFIAACNSVHVGKGMKMAPSAELSDGLIDLVIVEGDITRRRLISVLPKLFDGTHVDEPEVTYYQASSFSLYPETEDILNIDGELLGTTPIDVKVLKQAIEIFG